MEARSQARERTVVFLTGASGHVGKNLVPKLLESDDRSLLILLIRGASDAEVAERLDKVLDSLPSALDTQKTRQRIRAVRGDITLPRLGLSESCFVELASTVTHVIHSAASVMFRLSLEEARKTNVEGTKNVMALAREAKSNGRLQRVAYIGTAYVSGDRRGMIKEEELDCGQRFCSSYEQTKFEAEKYVRGLSGRLPMMIFRPSIIAGDSRTGRTSAFNAIYIPLKYISRGLVKFLPGSRSTPLDIVPSDYVCAAICHILFKTTDGMGKTFHLCAGRDRASTAGEVTDLAVEYLNQFQSPMRISRVRFIPQRVVRILELFLSRQVREKLKKLKAYAPYLVNEKYFETDNTRAALRGTGIEPPNFKRYFRSILRYSVLANWGEKPEQPPLSRFPPLLESQKIS